MALMALFQWCH